MSQPIDFTAHDFHPVVQLPKNYDVLDLSIPASARPARSSQFSIGRYNELRPDTYTEPLFAEGRTVHLGIDIGAPAGTAVYAFADGWIEHFGYNSAPGDYGNTLVTGHRLDSYEIYALHGHLDGGSICGIEQGQKIRRGEVLAHLGEPHENGGWPPHLHFQLSWQRPTKADLPGVVTLQDREAALRRYPDPRLVLGPLY